MKRRLLAILLSATMLLSMVACGGGDSEQASANNAAGKEGVYKVTDFKPNFGDDKVDDFNISSIKVVNDTLYMLMNYYLTNGYATKYVTADLQGNVLTEHTLVEQFYDYGVITDEAVPLAKTEVAVEEPAEDVDEYHNVNSAIILDDGRLAYIDTMDSWNNTTGESKTENTLIVCDAAGQESCRVLIQPELEEGAYYWINSMFESQEGTLLLLSSEFIMEVDLEGNVLAQIKTTEDNNNLYRPEFYKDGAPVFTVWNEDYTKQSYYVMDVRTGEKKEEIILPETFINYGFYDGTGSGYDLILSNNTGVYGYNFGDLEPTQIMNYINSDLATYRVNNIYFSDSENFIATYNDIVDYRTRLAGFKRIPPEEVPDKDILTLATFYTDTDVTKRVIDFNKTNEKYRIMVKDYSVYATNEDYQAGFTKLNNEIISGNVPDIIKCSDSIDLANYANKGILADFYELMDEDETINREDYCENVFRAYEIGGKLYELPIVYNIRTIYGKTEIWGEDTSLTWDEFHSVMAQYPEASSFSELTKRQALENGLMFTYNQLVDAETGECRFDSEMFKELLKFANTFPEEINWDELYQDDNYWINMETQYIEDRVLLSGQQWIYSVDEAWVNCYRTFNANATPVGFPNNDGIGSAVTAISSYAISAKSDYTDGAWEFVKSFITEEAQMPNERGEKTIYGLPILKKALERDAQDIKSKPYYYDQDGNKVEYDNTIWINNQEIILEPGTDADVEKWLNFCLSVDKKAGTQYQEAMEIISEEVEGYFSGQKSVDEVAGIVQSRMNIFISESM